MADHLTDWTTNGEPRRAGVSAFGIGGTNVHAVLEEAPPAVPSGPSRPWQVLLLAARTPAALERMTDALADRLACLKGRDPELSLADTAYTLRVGRRLFAHRRAVLAATHEEAVKALRTRDPQRVWTAPPRETPAGRRGVAFLLPGVGDQYPGLARGLYREEPVFRQEIDRCAELLLPHLGLDLRELLFAGEETAEAAAPTGPDLRALLGRSGRKEGPERALLRETRIAQPAMFAVGYALAKLWMSWSVRPAALLGYSLGEYTAACLAGVLELPDALALVSRRARRIGELPPGALLAVPLAEEEARARLTPELSLAAVNAPTVSVVSGPPAAVAGLERRLAEEGVSCRRLQADQAFHSWMMQPIVDELRELLRATPLASPRIPYLSNVTGTWITAAQATDPDYWVRHLISPVRFADGVAELWREPGRVLIEMGPGHTLSSLALQQIPAEGAADRAVLSSLRHELDRQPDQRFLLQTLGRLWLSGVEIDWSGFHGEERRRRVSLPAYPFERQRYWIEPGRAGLAGAAAPVALLLPEGAAVDPAWAAALESRGYRLVALPPGPPTPEALDELLAPKPRSTPETVPTAGHMRPGIDTPYEEPRTDLERRLAAIWGELLGIDRVGAHDNFFALGGHSLLGLQLVSRLQARLGVEIPLRTLFEAPSVAALAAEVEQLRGRGDTLDVAPPLVPAPRQGALPLSFAQQRLWFIDQLQPDTPLYNLPVVLRVEGPLEPAVLQRSLSEVVRRHEAVRTVFALQGDAPVQVIQPPAPFVLPRVNLSGLPEPAREAAALTLAAEEAGRLFDLARDLMLRSVLLRLAAEDHVLALTMHHVASDGWSMGTLVREVAALYAAFAQGQSSPLPELPVQYADFAVWQRSWLRGEVLEREIDWWRRQLAGLPPLLELPTDRPRPAVQSFRGAARPIQLTAELTRQAEELGRREGATLFMVLMAAFQAVLARYSGQDDFPVGTPVAGRNRLEIEGLIGFFVNNLVLRGDLAGDPTFRELLGRVRETELAAQAHQDVPFEKLVEELASERSLAHAPLVQVMFALQNTPGGSLEVQDLRLRAVNPEPTAAKFDLTLSLSEHDGGLSGTVEYATDLFDAATLDRLIASFERLLTAAAADPDLRVAELPFLSSSGRHQVLIEWNDTGGERWEGPMTSLVERWCHEQPDAAAVVDAAGRVLTYGDLGERSGRLAGFLRSLGVGPESIVAVLMERSADLLVAQLGVLKAAAAYLSLDPAHPAERLAFMLEETAVPVVLTQEALIDLLPGVSGRIVCLDRDYQEVAICSPLPGQAVEPDQLAYVIYTSGSTGRPKGVQIPHRGLLNLVRWDLRAHGTGPGDHRAQVASLGFDASVWEIWACLASGAALHLPPEAARMDPPRLAAWMAERGVTVAFLPTPLAEALFSGGGPRVPTLRRLLVGGDRLVVRPEPGRGFSLINHYGPTEASVVTSAGDSLTLGRPIEGLRVHLLDRSLQPGPPGVAGELWVGGPSLARGYLGDPGRTAERFLPDPWGAGERLYRTGDLCRYRRDGEIEFLGRVDNQVKIRGQRIELGEIEAVLSALPGVREAVAVVRGDRLVAYVTGEATGDALSRSLRERLPETMVPAAFVTLETLPLTPNGKVDRKALPAPEWERAEESFLAPRTPVEEVVAGIWAELLGLERVGAADHFFALGGHSLLAARVVSRLRRAFGVEVPVRDLFEAPTVEALAARVEAARRTGAILPAPPLLPAPREGALPLSFAQQRLWFIAQLEPDSPLYNMPGALWAEGLLDGAVLALCLGEIARRHEALRTVFAAPEGLPVQVIQPVQPFPLPVVDLSGLPEGVREALALTLIQEEAGRPFDLTRGPLLRGLLVRVAERDHAVGLTLHHIVGDGWSLGLLIREIAALYPVFAARLPSPLPELPVQYADFAVWQRSWLRGEVLEQEIAWWRRQLAGLPPLLELPTDRPRPAAQSYRGANRPVRLPAGLTRELETLARREGATLFMVLLAAFQSLLARASGQDDLAVGSPVAGRGLVETEDLIGFFVNTLVLRSDLAGAPAFRELLGRVRETALAAYLHQDVPFEKLVEELAPERSLAHGPLFQVMLVLQNAPVGSLEIEALCLRPMGDTGTLAKFDLTLNLSEYDGGLVGTVEYATDLFDAATVDRLILHYERLLTAALAAPERLVAELPLLSPAERHQAITEWNDTVAPPVGEVLLHDLLTARAEQAPELPALVQGQEQLTHGELAARSDRLAAHLRALGAGPDVLVAIFLERSVDLVVALLAVLKAGGAYLPLETSLPGPRLSFMLDDSGAPFLLTRTGLLPALPEHSCCVVCLDDLPEIADDGGQALRPAADNLAYVLYTSGSTGTPKGVAIPHRGLANYLLWAMEAYPVGKGRGAPVHSPIGFDLTVTSLFLPLLAGRRVDLVPEEDGVEGLAAALAEGGFGLVKLTPAHLDVLQRLLPPERVAGCAEAFVLGGEPLSGEQLAFWRLHAPGLRLINEYGPTETVVGCCAYEIPASVPPAGPVPIGRPIANTRILILDPELFPVPVGTPGELYIGGAGLCRGYLHRPDLTAERLVPDLFGMPGERLYRTGDLARRLPDGRIEFLGRSDHQVKIRGFRIELGEIEAALVSVSGVREAVVLARADRSLVAYVVGAIAVEELRRSLRERLPDYMIPAAFVTLAALPLTANGKVDREALPAPQRQSAPETYLAPRTPVEEVLAGIWAQVLRLPRVGVNDNFFEMGGHSLLATQVMSHLRAAFSVEMPLRDLFEAPTVEGLAARVEVARRTGVGLTVPPLLPVPREGALPLSFAQQRLWFVDQLEPGRPTYNMPLVLGAEGPLDPRLLALTLGAIVSRHQALRTVFAAPKGKPMQVIQPPTPFVLPLVDLSGLPETARETAARSLASEEAAQPFDLARDPMLRGVLLRLAEKDHTVALTLHHVASDGWSMGILVREVAAFYAALAEDRPPSMPELPVQYADYAVWQRSWLHGEVLEREIDWWRRQLAGLPPLLELPADRPRPAIRSDRGAVRLVSLKAGLTRQAEALARSEGATLFMVLLAAFQTLLARYSGQDELAVGTLIAGRNREEIEGLIGFFLNTLVLRGDLTGAEPGGPTFREVLGRARETALAAYLHQDVPFEKVVDELAPERNLAQTPLFQVMLALQNLPAESLEIKDLRLRLMDNTRRLAKLDLSLTLSEQEGELAGEVEYATDLFDAPTIDRFIGHFERLFAGAAAEPDRQALDVPVASEAESSQILYEWNDTEIEAFTDACLHHEVAAQAARTPSAVAIEFEAERWTYRRLVGSARRLARHLRTLGVGPDVVVGLCVERSPAMVMGMLAVLEAGGAWLPLDPVHPPERLGFLVEDGGVRILLIQDHLRGRVAAAGLAAVPLDGRWDAGEDMGEPLGVEVSPDHLAYVIYTSGSTGKPKGVMVPHRGVCNRLWSAVATNRIDERDAFLQKAAFGFDVSVWECFTPLLAGARLVQTEPGREGDGPYLVRLIREYGVTLVDFVPAMLAAFLDEEDVESCTSLRQVFVGGEALTPELRERTLARLGVPIDNLCGPTEVTIDTTRWVCMPGQDPHRVPLGRPIANSRLYVVDPEMRLVPIGIAGEEMVGGVGVTRGYVRRPDLTAARYIPDPFSGQPGARMYRSGDLVRWLRDGSLDILGRLDHQVKVRGFRVELGEIEAALAALPGVQQAIVLVREDGVREDSAPRRSAGRRLVAYVVGEAGDMTADKLRRSLRERLPEYMVPSAFVQLAEFPLTPNGKVDRKALPAPEQPGADENYVAPRTREEEILAAVWAQVLRAPRVGVGDNFFELGGDSILSVQIVARARQAGLYFTVRQVFEHQTVAGLALCATTMGDAGAPPAEQGPVAGEVPLTPIQRWFFEQGFADPHHFNQAVLLESREHLAPAALERAMAAVVEHHDALRMRFDFTSEGGWRQENALAEPVAPFHQVDLSGLPAPRWRETFEQAAAALQTGFDLSAGPLTRLCLINAGPGQPAWLLWAVHHLVVDGVSWRVLLEDLEGAYRQALRGLRPIFPAKTTSFQEWARRLAEYASSDALAGELDHWRETARVPVPLLPVDFGSSTSGAGNRGNLVGDEATVSFELSAEETADLLQTLPSVYHNRIDDALLSALVRALANWTGSPRLRVDLEGHGREPIFGDVYDLDVSHTVGWFTSLYPVVLEAGDADPGEALVSASERLRAVPGRGIGYGLLRYLGNTEAAPAAEILFNYLGQVDSTSEGLALFRASSASAGPMQSPRAHRTHPLEIVGLVADGRLRITLTYGSRIHRRETAEHLAAAYAEALRQLIQHGRESKEGLGALTPRLEEEGGAPWSPLVPIQPLGAQVPLFCIHALGGEVLAYYPLARQLGTDRPFYGLRARPIDGQTGQAAAPRITIEDMASEYLDAVRSLQPAGPYLLAGYSFGGIVAFEMARQLTSAGEEVALLAILDEGVPLCDEAAEVDTAAVIADMVRHHSRDQGITPALHAAELRGLPLELQLARGLEVLGSMEALGPGFDIPLLRDLTLGWSSRATAAERYRASTYPGRITLLRASSVDQAALWELPSQRRQIFEDPTLGWDTVAAGGVEVHTVPGNHQTIIGAPHVETLAEILGTCIARAERGAPAVQPMEV